MAATFEGGVVLGADSRTSTGNFVANRAADKITPLADKVWICRCGNAARSRRWATSYAQCPVWTSADSCYLPAPRGALSTASSDRRRRSGSAADTQNVSWNVSHALEQHCQATQEPVDVRTAASIVQQVVYRYKDHLQAGLIVAGWDKVTASRTASAHFRGDTAIAWPSMPRHRLLDAFVDPERRSQQLIYARVWETRVGDAALLPWCAQHEGGTVWALPLGGTLFKEPYHIGGSGSAYITGWCDKVTFRRLGLGVLLKGHLGTP